MRVLGTAGHVDHGKSTLIRCLTGIDPDRLPEEKSRAMTIDLGFAWLPLSDGELLGVIDVPGHRDFISNMLAGVGGIDAVLFVIAADEGVMPQTREHLAILDLLDLRHGVIALTKTDLIHDPDWLELIQTDIREQFAQTSLANLEIIPISAVTGAGIPSLRKHLTGLAPLPRPDLGQPRLPIDRVFTITGFGTVVTGTLLGGSLHLGDAVVVQPSGLQGRIRGLQTYQQQVTSAQPGSRVAVNLAGVERSAVKRGDVLTLPDTLIPTQRLDVRFRHLPTADSVLKHNMQVKLYVGTAETVARVRLLADDQIAPGADGWVQFELDQPLAVTTSDRVIVRRPSPAQTIGGGVIVDPHPARRWRRFQPTVVHELETRLMGTPAERLAQAANELAHPHALLRELGFPPIDFDRIFGEAVQQKLIVRFSDSSILSVTVWKTVHARLLAELMRFHMAFPLRLGMPREELRSQLQFPPAVLALYLAQVPEITDDADLLRLETHSISFDYAQTQAVEQLLATMQGSSGLFAYAEASALVGAEVLPALIELKQILRLNREVLITQARYTEIAAAVLRHIDEHGSITAAELRDQLNTSRKFAIALLEHLDAVGVTKRQGAGRIRR